MLAKKYLLNKKEVFLLKQKGKVVHRTPLFNVFALKIPEENTLKFAFIVSKKVSKKAVERNKAKRILAEAIRTNLGKFKGGYFYGFYLKKEMLKTTYEEINNLVDKKISKIPLP